MQSGGTARKFNCEDLREAFIRCVRSSPCMEAGGGKTFHQCRVSDDEAELGARCIDLRKELARCRKGQITRKYDWSKQVPALSDKEDAESNRFLSDLEVSSGPRLCPPAPVK
ncbi:Mitochondrial protein PET191 [Balamuthia mandrillaris]